MISHKHKCVFVHIPKCGGQSIEHIFLKDCGLTWRARAPLLLRKNSNRKKGPPRLAHLSYQQYLNLGYISADLIKKYTSFSVVRNPYARVESLYKYLGFDSAITFRRFILEVLRYEICNKGSLYWFVKPQYKYVCDDLGNVMVDYIIKLEDISSTMPVIFKKIGLNVYEVPHVNRSTRRSVFKKIVFRLMHALKGRLTFTPFFDNTIDWDEELLSAVEQIYHTDFEIFGYAINRD